MPAQTNHGTISLREFMTMRFGDIEKRLDEISRQIIGRERFESWTERVARVEEEVDEHQSRLQRIERSLWLLQIMVGLLLPVVSAVVIALLIAWITGQMEIRFK